MNVKEVLAKCNTILSENKIIAPDYNAGVFMCSALKCTHTWIYTNLYYEIPTEIEEQITSSINRRMKGEPLQYIVGETGFMNLDIKVGPGILIPRSDTEVLVETVIEIAKGEIKFLDMCTGSGCIAASIAKALPEAYGDAVDISEVCIGYAIKNCTRANVINRVNIFKSNLFENIKERDYDIIVSNPPYIPTKDIDGLMSEVKDYEPMQALDGGEDGLDFIKEIIKNAYDYLIPGGLLVLETGYDQLGEVTLLMNEKYINVENKKDYGGNHRIVYGYK